MMNRINFGARSGAVIDRCKEHGVWLDAGELRQLCEWMKLGGKLLDKEKTEELKKGEIFLEERRRQSRIQSGTAADYSDLATFDLRSSKNPDLLDVVLKVIRFFRKF
jgi:Zn-finger nucleic acid-binding protein